MRRAWAIAKGNLAALALVGALGSAPAAPAAAQEQGGRAADAPSRKVIRTKRLRVPADLFERDAVFFKRARGLGGAGRGRHRRELRRRCSLGAAQEGRHLGRRSAVTWAAQAAALRRRLGPSNAFQAFRTLSVSAGRTPGTSVTPP
jgi:hypothetical protein